MDPRIETDIYNNRRLFEKRLRFIRRVKDGDQKIVLAKMLANCAAYRHTGYFSSCELESIFMEEAEKIDDGIASIDCGKGSVLHVITECYQGGGHTRIVERWMKQSDERQSIFLIDQNADLPEWIEAAVHEKGGEIHRCTDTWEAEKARKLRAVAGMYEYVVLHTHFYDPVPILAFGVESFCRPVIYLNHADHIFWLGVSVSDVIAELRSSGKSLSIHRRGVEAAELVCIPVDCANGRCDKSTARRRLGIPPESKVILSIGGSFKYKAFGRYDFIRFAEDLIGQTDDSIFYVIGPKGNEKKWRDAFTRSGGRIIALGEIYSNKIDEYRAAADLFIESFPFGSSTALLETGLMDVNVLALNTEMNSIDICHAAGIQCSSVEELIKTSKHVLEGKIEKKIRNDILRDHCGEGWRNKKEKLLANVRKTHEVRRNFQPGTALSAYDEYLYGLTRHSYPKELIINIKDYERLRLIYKLMIIHDVVVNYRIADIVLVIRLFAHLLGHKTIAFMKKAIRSLEKTEVILKANRLEER